MRRMLAVLTVAVVVVLGLAAPTHADETLLPDLPTSPAGDPPGANDWACVPTAQRPTPVILVHGTFGDRRNLLERMSRKIKEAGFCVYSLDYGNRATEDIRTQRRSSRPSPSACSRRPARRRSRWWGTRRAG